MLRFPAEPPYAKILPKFNLAGANQANASTPSCSWRNASTNLAPGCPWLTDVFLKTKAICSPPHTHDVNNPWRTRRACHQPIEESCCRCERLSVAFLPGS